MRRAAPTSFTLIEMLAVIAIASLTIAIVAVSMAGASQRTSMLRTEAMLRQMDARARMHARTSGERIVLLIDVELRTLSLVNGAGETLSNFAIPHDVQAMVETSVGANRIVFDARGRSLDYSITLRAATGDQQRAKRIDARGLTGEMFVSEVIS